MIDIRNITKAYGEDGNRQNVLNGISVKIEERETTVILGASGSGKSTFLNVISGLERPDRGEILYGELDIAKLSEKELCNFRKERIGFVFQQYYLIPNMNVDKNVKMGAELTGNKDYKKIISALGLENKLNKYPSELSGGEQQRVAVARALAKKPEFLFLDEPTGALDEKTGRNLLDYLYTLQKEFNFTQIMVTHNQNIALTADTVIKVNSGEITETYRNTEKKTAYEIGW